METDPSTGPDSSPVLESVERRVLGVLIEKAKTTPESNREPVMNLSDAEVERALPGLQKKTLVNRLQGSGRVERWRHIAYETWKVDKTELAILAELLLRGPQTEGELRGRASRMEPIDDIEQLRVLLMKLAERRLVVYLTPVGRRGTVLTHGFHAPSELDRLRSQHVGVGDAGSDEPVSKPAAAPPVTPKANDDIVFLREKLAELEVRVAEQERQIQELKASLGV
jgi:uncharacterized protein YceH (UPF0502 family)